MFISNNGIYERGIMKDLSQVTCLETLKSLLNCKEKEFNKVHKEYILAKYKMSDVDDSIQKIKARINFLESKREISQ